MEGRFVTLAKEIQNKFGVKNSYNPLSVTKIILADDNPMCNNTLRLLIEQVGYQVHPCFNGVDVTNL